MADARVARKKVGVGLALAALAGAVSAGAVRRRREPVPGDRRELVFLVHGLGRTPVSMLLLARRLERHGYRTASFGYWSTTGTVRGLSGTLARHVAAAVGDAPAVHFVGHSLGNIVIRGMLAHHRPERAGRVVMLAPPNQGSAAADRYAPWIGWLMPHIRELVTGPESTARTLRLPGDVDVGIIAGLRDGKVSVAETHLEGAREHAVVPCRHTFIMNRRDVHGLVTGFLRDGSFGLADAGAGEPASAAC